MQWSDYKVLCDSPDHQSRWMIEQTLELAKQLDNEAIRHSLSSILKTQPIEVPSDHRGGPFAEIYELGLCIHLRRQICELVMQAKQENLTSTLTAERGLAGFEEAWTEYRDYCG